MKKILLTLAGAAMLAGPAAAVADEYTIDTPGMHAFVQFRIKHLGYSWLYGRFNSFDGEFAFDEAAPGDASVSISIDTTSIDTNHAERDKHLRSDDFLNVGKFPEATFVSTKAELDGEGNGTITGDFTLMGVKRPITIDVEGIGAGEDPWGGYRRGFEGRTSFALADFGLDYNLGPASREIEIILSVEGKRK